MATANQIRAARAYLLWTEAKLAQMSKLSVAAVQRIERESNAPANDLSAARRALEAAGIVFLEANGIVSGEGGLRKR